MTINEWLVEVKAKTQTESFASVVLSDLIPSIGKENVPKIAKNYAMTKFMVYGDDAVLPPYTPTKLIKEITDRLVGTVNFATDKFLVIYTVEWANYLQAIHGVPAANITVVCDERREQFCKYAGYGVISADDFLADEFNEDDDLKFNVIVGNPPYQDSSNKAANNKLWHKFVKRCDPKARNPMTTNNTITALVTPSSIFIDYVGFGKWFVNEYLVNKCLIEAKIHREVKHFDAMVETCHWVICNKPDQNLVDVPKMRDSLIDTIIAKVDDIEPKLRLLHENQGIISEHLHIGTHNFYYSGQNMTTTEVKPENSGRLKIVFPFSASYHSQFVTSESTGHFNKSLFVDSEEHARRVMSYTMSKLYRFFAQHYMKTSGFTPAVKNTRLPMLDDREYTNEEIYQIFDLTPEEIDYVETNTK